MYDFEQHRNLFNGPGDYLFRGALLSSEFVAPYERLGITPTSIDPAVATLFACRYRMEGQAVVLIARKSVFHDLLDGPNLACFSYERAVNIIIHPADFERQSERQVTVDVSVAILHDLGYQLPSKLPDLDALTQALWQTAGMRMEEINRYVERCLQLPKSE